MFPSNWFSIELCGIMVSWFFCMCSLSLALRANDEWQNVHLWILIASLPPSSWSFSCTSRLHCLLNAFPQTEQLYGFSPVCVNKCDLSCPDVLNALEHMWHFALRILLWTFMWERNECWPDSIFPQISHCTRGPYCWWNEVKNEVNWISINMWKSYTYMYTHVQGKIGGILGWRFTLNTL